MLGGDCLAEGRARRVGVEEVGGAGVARCPGWPRRTDQCRVLRAGDRGAEVAAAAVGLDERRERRCPTGCKGTPRPRQARRVVLAATRSGCSTPPTRPPSRSRLFRVRVDDRRDQARSCRRTDRPCRGCGFRGWSASGAPTITCSQPRDGRAELRTPAPRPAVRDVNSMSPKFGLGRVALELVDLARAAILAGRADHDIGVGRAHRRRRTVRHPGRRRRESSRVASRSPNVVLSALASKTYATPSPGPESELPGAPTTSSLPTTASDAPNSSPGSGFGSAKTWMSAP